MSPSTEIASHNFVFNEPFYKLILDLEFQFGCIEVICTSHQEGGISEGKVVGSQSPIHSGLLSNTTDSADYPEFLRVHLDCLHLKKNQAALGFLRDWE